MSGFQENLVGVGHMCDADCTVTVSKHAVNIYSPNGTPIITGYSEFDGTRLWSMSLITNAEVVHLLSSDPEAHKTSLQAFSEY